MTDGPTILNDAAEVFMGRQPVGGLYLGDEEIWAPITDYFGTIMAADPSQYYRLGELLMPTYHPHWGSVFGGLVDQSTGEDSGVAWASETLSHQRSILPSGEGASIYLTAGYSQLWMPQTTANIGNWDGTIEFWIEPHAVPGSWAWPGISGWFFNAPMTDGGITLVTLAYSDTQGPITMIEFRLGGTQSYEYTPAVPMPIYEPIYIVVRAGETVSLWVNGELATDSGGRHGSLQGAVDWNWGPEGSYSGYAQEFAVYSRNLEDEEIRAHFRAGGGRI
jgi:hypothetical protein